MKAATAFALLALVACVAPNTAEKEGIPCALELLGAAETAELVAEARVERMKVMRFGSEAAMNEYIAESNRLESEAGRMRQTLADLEKSSGHRSNYSYELSGQTTEEQAAGLIAAADACLAKLPG